MNLEPAITVDQVSKTYRIWPDGTARLRGAMWEAGAALIPPIRHVAQSRLSKLSRDFHALQDISFEVGKGESVGILGRNGSGKSTLLQIIAGTLQPTTGRVLVRGRVAALLELGSGFNPDFTGRENIYLNGAILGLSRAEIDDRFEAIASFADIGDFIDEPVKTYSSGMALRVAFAVQVQVEPDILIVDEALSVGDALFQKRCFRRIEELRSNGTTLLFVSHDQESVRTLTQRAILLKQGRIRAAGPSSEVVLEYRRLLHEEEAREAQRATHYLQANAAESRTMKAICAKQPPPPYLPLTSNKEFGDRNGEVLFTKTYNERHEPQSVFYPGDLILIHVRCRLHCDLENLNVNVRIRNKEGIKMYSWGTLQQDMAIRAGLHDGIVFRDLVWDTGIEFDVWFETRCNLGSNFYEIQSALCVEHDPYQSDQRILHWQDDAAFFEVKLRQREYQFGGVCDMQMKATWARYVSPVDTKI